MKNLGNVLILGDSYSTFLGSIPKENSTYYGREDTALLGVNAIENTWWYLLMQTTNSTLLWNESFSGSTLSYTGYPQNDKNFSRRISFVARLEKLIANGFFKDNRVDTILVFGGTNDFWANSPWGDCDSEDFSQESLVCVAPATKYLLRKLKEVAPNARKIGIINTDFSREFVSLLQTVFEKENTECIPLTYLDKQNLHPTAKGMQDIVEQLLQAL